MWIFKALVYAIGFPFLKLFGAINKALGKIKMEE